MGKWYWYLYPNSGTFWRIRTGRLFWWLIFRR